MNLLDLKRQPNQHLVGSVEKIEQYIPADPLIKKYLQATYGLDIKYLHNLGLIEVDGIIDFTILAKDARDGQEFEYSNEINWNDEYTFNPESNENANIIIGNDFNLDEYIIEQININIPVNLSINHDIIFKIGSGWQLMSEQQYSTDIDNQAPDSRWDQLDDLELTEKK